MGLAKGDGPARQDSQNGAIHIGALREIDENISNGCILRTFLNCGIDIPKRLLGKPSFNFKKKGCFILPDKNTFVLMYHTELHPFEKKDGDIIGKIFLFCPLINIG